MNLTAEQATSREQKFSSTRAQRMNRARGGGSRPQRPIYADRTIPKPSKLRSLVKAQVAAAPELLREQYAEPGFLIELSATVKRLALAGDRTGLHIVHDTLGATGAREDFAAALRGLLGVTLDVARKAVTVAQDAQALASDPAAMLERAESLLAEHYAGNPAAVARSPLAPYFAQRIEPQ